jgi:hypothetical protein
MMFYVNLFCACLAAFTTGFCVCHGLTGLTYANLVSVALNVACVVSSRINAEKDALQEASGE